uniref:Uncharacterized protein n=1 Tax=Apteryx owenii TaxID=8824 RepID=A0A8B9PRK5_APTOW
MSASRSAPPPRGAVPTRALGTSKSVAGAAGLERGPAPGGDARGGEHLLGTPVVGTPRWGTGVPGREWVPPTPPGGTPPGSFGQAEERPHNAATNSGYSRKENGGFFSC